MVTRALLLLSLCTLAAGCDCNSSTPIQPDAASACEGGCAAGTFCCKKTLACEPEKKTCSNGSPSCAAGQEIVYPAPPYMDENSCEPIPLQCTCGPAGGDSLKPGMVGRFSALAAASGKLMASAYESSFGDLLLVTQKTDSLDGTPALEIVDGVPQKPPTKATSGWRGGIEDPGDDVGQDTDIVVGTGGEPSIAYLDVTHRSLKLATRAAGKWMTHVVDQPKGDKDLVGRYASMILLDGKPAVAYLALYLQGSAGAWSSELRWAVASSATPAATSDWTITVIDSKPMSCQSLCAASEACVLKTDGTSACQAKVTTCSPACATDEACVAGGCKKALADAKYLDTATANGLWPAAVRTSAGPLVVYYDKTAGKLRAAVLAGGAWKKAVLAGVTGEDVGAFPAVASDGGSVVHVSYQDAGQLTLKYLQLDSASLLTSAKEVIDDGVRIDGQHPVGSDSALLLDGSGVLRVVYQDAQRVDLLAARRAGPGQWTPALTTDPDLGRSLKGGAKGYGFYSDLVVEGGQVYGSTFFYDAQATPKGSLSFFKLP